MAKIIGVIPVRMGSSRFPGKPLFRIAGMPMLEHVWHRAKMYHDWDELFLATCDDEIKEFADSKKIPCIMTSNKHERALDRVTEAVEKSDFIIKDNDIVLNVQGDEPMIRPDMITATVQPMLNDAEVNGVVLSMPITDEEQFNDPNTLKIIHNIKGDILYTSRAPIPYCKEWSPNIGAKRIYGIFGFRWNFLQKFTQIPESPLEIVESCDSNRLYDNGLTQRVAFYPYIDSFAVDTPEDAVKVEKYIKNDPYWVKYNNTAVELS
jgi:3-deoxy-manno-octulosonate cytidylyltransferase (CMP-KDO synthetase)